MRTGGANYCAFFHAIFEETSSEDCQIFKTIADLKDWIREQLEMEREWQDTDARGSKGRAVAVVESGNHEEPDDDEASETDMAALFALSTDSTPEEINAVQQRFRRFGKQGRAR